MAYRLKSRVHQIPNGFRYIQAEIKWDSTKVLGRGPSWERLVMGLIAARLANPAQCAKHNWSTDVETVANEVDAYNAKICADAGHLKYLSSGNAVGPPVPKGNAPSASETRQLAAVAGRVEKIWTGIRTVNDWIDSNDPPVPSEQSGARALTCSQCPQNGTGDFTSWFTQPASDAIKRQIQRLQSRKLSTPHDDKIKICEVCLCPLHLKVHTPLKYIEAHLKPSVMDALRSVKGCWIIQELGDSITQS
jgi:hypothetical protein